MRHLADKEFQVDVEHQAETQAKMWCGMALRTFQALAERMTMMEGPEVMAEAPPPGKTD